MTKKELSQFYWLNKEVEQLEYRVEALKTRCEKCTQTITDMPKGGPRIDLKDELADLSRLLECKRQQCIIELSRLERYINSIPDSSIRVIMSLRYIRGMTWQRIAFEIGEYDESCPRRKCNRFLKSAENAEYKMIK